MKDGWYVDNKLESILKRISKNPSQIRDKSVKDKYLDLCLRIYHTQGYNMYCFYIRKLNYFLKRAERREKEYESRNI